MVDVKRLCPGCMRFREEGTNGQTPCPYCGFEPGTGKGGKRSLLPFTILAGKYLLGNAVGAGGFGIIYIALDLTKEERIAVKEFFPVSLARRAGDQVEALPGEEGRSFREALRSFRREASLLARFSGTGGIVGYRDFVEENGTAYLVMDYVEGPNLRLQMRRMGAPFSQEKAMELMRPILLAVEEMHSRQVLHRDISPENLILGPDGKLTLIDFGAAREFHGGEENLTVILKRGYAPEEQYHSGSRQGPWTDIYACCAVLYQMVSGILPQEADRRKAKDQVMPLDEIPGIKVTEGFARAIEKGMTIQVTERYASVESLMKDLNLSGPDEKRRKEAAALSIEIEKGPVGMAGTGKRAASGQPEEKKSADGLERRDESGCPETLAMAQHSKGKRSPRKAAALAALLICCLTAGGAVILGSFGDRRGRGGAAEEETWEAETENGGETELLADEDWWPAYKRAVAYLEEKDYEQAIQNFEWTIEAMPDFSDAYKGLAVAYLEQEQTEEAVATLNWARVNGAEDEEISQMLEELEAYEDQETVSDQSGEGASEREMVTLAGRILQNSPNTISLMYHYDVEMGYLVHGLDWGLDLTEMGGVDVEDESGQIVHVSQVNMWSARPWEGYTALLYQDLEGGQTYTLEGFWLSPQEYYGQGDWVDEYLFGPKYTNDAGDWYEFYPYGHFMFYPVSIVSGPDGAAAAEVVSSNL